MNPSLFASKLLKVSGRAQRFSSPARSRPEAEAEVGASSGAATTGNPATAARMMSDVMLRFMYGSFFLGDGGVLPLAIAADGRRAAGHGQLLEAGLVLAVTIDVVRPGCSARGIRLARCQADRDVLW